MYKDIFSKVYQRILLESKEDFLTQYHTFKNLVSNLKWNVHDSRILSSFTDELKKINDSLKSSGKIEERSQLVEFKNAIKYGTVYKDENNLIEKFLNKNLCGKKNQVTKESKEKIITRRQVLRDICYRYNIWENINLVRDLYRFIEDCSKNILSLNGQILIPTSKIEKIIYDYKPYIGLISNNDSGVGPGEIWLILKYNLQFSLKKHVDLQTCDGSNLYEVKGNNAGIHLGFNAPDKELKSSCLCNGLGVDSVEKTSYIVKKDKKLIIIPATLVRDTFEGKFRKQEFTHTEWKELDRRGTTQIRIALIADELYNIYRENNKKSDQECDKEFMNAVKEAKKVSPSKQFLEYKARSGGSVAVDEKFFNLVLNNNKKASN